MILSAHQPYFIPYLAYWQLIALADHFLIADDYAFMKSGWINRNRILVNGQPVYLRLEISQKSSNRYINETELVPINVERKMETLYMAYHKAPYFKDGSRLMRQILEYPDTNLAQFLTNSIHMVCKYLSIDTPISLTSDIPGNNSFHREERAYDFCEKLGADTFVNAIGGQDLYDYSEFKKRGVTLRFLNCGHPEYRQFGNAFVEKLSIIDAIMFNSRKELDRMLKDYTFING